MKVGTSDLMQYLLAKIAHTVTKSCYVCNISSLYKTANIDIDHVANIVSP